jgi:DNA-binding MarR family transcriptional regulator
MNAQTRQRTVHEAIETLQKLSELLQRRRVQLAKQVGLTEQQWRVLEEITTEHFIPSLFARNRDSSAAAVSKIVRQLTEKQLINVTISRVDGRQRRYVLTAKGKKLMEQIRSHRLRAIDAIWTDLDIEELQQFNQFSSRLMQSIETFSKREE